MREKLFMKDRAEMIAGQAVICFCVFDSRHFSEVDITADGLGHVFEKLTVCTNLCYVPNRSNMQE